MYNYREEMKKDICEAIKNNYYDSIDYETLYDLMWIDDDITGNGSGLYTEQEQAKQYVLENMPLAIDAFKEFDCINKFTQYLVDMDYESIDVTIRCYLLSECLQEVLDENDFE